MSRSPSASRLGAADDAGSNASTGDNATFKAERRSHLGATLRWTLAASLVLGVHGAAGWVLLAQQPAALPQGAHAAPILIDMAPPVTSPEAAAILPASEETPEPQPEPVPEAGEPPAVLPDLQPKPEAETLPPESVALEPDIAEHDSPRAEPDVPEETIPVAAPVETLEPEAPPEDEVAVPVPTFRPPTPPAVLEAMREDRRERSDRRQLRQRAERQERREEAKRAERSDRRETRKARPASPPSVASQGGLTGQASQGDAASQAAQTRWQNAVQARLNRSKRTPAGGGSGTVSIAFVMDSNGRVASARITHSAGAMLDNAAIALVRRASPFPAPPGGRGASLTVPIRFE